MNFLSKKGFTFLETMFVVSIGASLAVAGIGVLISLKQSRLNNFSFQLIDHLRATQSKAASGFKSSNWGAYFTPFEYTLFKGTGYDDSEIDSDASYVVPSASKICWQFAGTVGDDELVFEQNTGKPLNIGIIIVENPNVGKNIISINAVGKISYEPSLADYCYCGNDGEVVCQNVDICHTPLNRISSEVQIYSDSPSLTCQGTPATIYVQNGYIVGGPDNGQPYEGILRSGNNSDVIAGTDGNDVIYSGNQGDKICAFEGRNLIYSGNGSDEVYTGYGDDVILGGNSKDKIYSLGGNNYILGGNGNDIICSGNGDDVVDAGDGGDVVNARGGKNIVNGGNGPDVCWQDGKMIDCETIQDTDVCPALPTPAPGQLVICHYAIGSRQTLFIEESDLLYYLMQGDVIGTCDEDNETRTLNINAIALLAHLDHGDSIGECVQVCHSSPLIAENPIGNQDKILICHYPEQDPQNPYNLRINQSQLVHYIKQGDVIGGCDGSTRTLNIGADIVDHHLAHGDVSGECSINSPSLTCQGTPATIYVQNGYIVGGPDNGQPYEGILRSGNNSDVIAGTDGNDVIYSGNQGDKICAFEGRNLIYSGNGSDEVYTGYGDDVILGGNSKDKIYSLGGNNYILGGNGNDIICSGNGDDVVDAGDGSDRINARGGFDILNGENGDDTCLNGEKNISCESSSGSFSCYDDD